MRPRLLCLLALCGGGVRGEAQVVAGTVSERGTSAPITGAVISLVDVERRVVATVLADETGRFEVRAPRAGRYALEAKRIGVARTSTDFFDLGDGERLERSVVVDAIVPRLTRVITQQTRSCTRRPDQDAETLQLWEDARAALTATAITGRRAVRGTISKFEREVDFSTDGVRRYDVIENHGDVTHAFRSVPAAQLGAEGYVVSSEGFFTYYAPDAEVLLSDEFAARHCFHVVTTSRGGDTLVGLAFEPTRGSRHTDITGALWLNASTSELREVTFTYRGLVQTADRSDFGGAVHFLRMPNGGWIVDDWVIRMPFVVADDENPAVPNLSSRRRRPVRGHLAGIHEAGGSVRPDRLDTPRAVSLRGVVVDSGGSPMQGVTVALTPTPFVARADSAGAFVFTGVRPGVYGMSLRSPEMDSLRVPTLLEDIRVPDTTWQRLRFPSRSEMASRLCGADPRQRETAVVRSFLVDAATGAPLRGARARVRWRSYARVGADTPEHSLEERLMEVNVDLDDRGSWLGCRLPIDRTIEVEAAEGTLPAWKDTLYTRAGEVSWRVRKVTTSRP